MRVKALAVIFVLTLLAGGAVFVWVIRNVKGDEEG